MHLHAGQAVGRGLRPRRVGGQLIAAGEADSRHHPLVARGQRDDRRIEVQLVQRREEPLLDLGLELGDPWVGFGVELGLGPAGHFASTSRRASSRF